MVKKPQKTRKKHADELPEPPDLAAEAITELEVVVEALREIVAQVEKEEGVEK